MSHLRSNVRAMKKTPHYSKRHHAVTNATAGGTTTATDLAIGIHFQAPDVLSALHSMMRHPRSLARPLPTWRPPTLELPRVNGLPRMRFALTRYRVGPETRAQVHGFGEERIPAYLMNARVTDPTGAPVSAITAEAWIRALVPTGLDGSIHLIDTPTAATFVWLTDRDFAPLRSPSSLFSGLADAA